MGSSILTVILSAAALFAQPQLPPTELEAVVTTEMGTFRFEFAPDKAPKHVAHFLKLAREGYYDGSAFHRVVARGIIQGGDPLLRNPKTPKNLWGSGGLNLLAGEYSDLKHDRGIVSTVRIPNKADSDGSQFFVCVSPQAVLDGQFSAFGRVTEGMDVVEKISQVPAGENGITEKPVRIQKVIIEKKKVEPFLNAPIEELKKTVTLKTTLGEIKLQMDPQLAPNHVRNFLKLVATGWLDSTVFHRIVKDFVVQGGMGEGRSTGDTHTADRWVRTLKAEFSKEAKHTRGIVSMARGQDPDSADTSFFLMLAAAPHLDNNYTIFAHMISGLEVLAAFEKEEVEAEKPKRRIELITATID
ncbi:MAG: peptidylprolyl isomerase [Acidobacteria bacterium]|nr:peptidylprolyl isomerase [Acidobacteriota bacterium]